MKKKTSYIIFFMMIVGLYSCNTNENSDLKVTLSDGDCLMDTSTYMLMVFYDNGAVKRNGFIKNMKLDGWWSDYYRDGNLRRKFLLENDIIIRPESRKIFPEIIFENDSLKIGVETRARVLNLYPDEQFGSVDNVRIDKLQDDSEYDYSLLPMSGDTAYFYFLTKIKTKNPDINYKKYTKDLDVSEKTARELAKDIYMPKSYLLDKCPIYK